MLEFGLINIVILFLVGTIAGFLNVLAGGGSLLTLPVLIFMGLPSSIANGTNRVAILFQSVFAITGFRNKGVFPVKLAMVCTVPALLGSYIGASMAVDINDEFFKKILGVIMISVMIFTIIDPMRRWKIDLSKTTLLRSFILVLTFFAIGLYGGFVQAGVGFLIISGLLAHGLDLVRINAVKVIVIFMFTILALGVFVVNGQVNYPMGISLAIGNSLGGFFATHFAVEKGHDWIKKVVTATVFVFAVKLLAI